MSSAMDVQLRSQSIRTSAAGFAVNQLFIDGIFLAPHLKTKVERELTVFIQAAKRYGFTNPSPNRLSAVAMMISSLERGFQPSTRRALSALVRRTCPSIGSTSRSRGTRCESARTDQSGS